MDKQERAVVVFGAFDGCVSIVGFVFALMLNGSSNRLIAIGAFGGAISAMVSMSLGQFEETEGTLKQRIGPAIAMAIATLAGSLVPVIGFFFLPRPAALLVGAIGALGIATWIGFLKRKGLRGHVEAYLTLLVAVALTLGIISLLPAAAGG